MKEDILEQAVDDWLLSKSGTFTKHNVKFKPSSVDPEFKKGSDAVNSDIDVLAIHTNLRGANRVSVVSCKSWQNGFSPEDWFKKLKIENTIVYRRPTWKYFREIAKRKWGAALAKKIYEETKSPHYTYYIVVTKLKGRNLQEHIDKFENDSTFIQNLKYKNSSKVKIKIISFKEIFEEYKSRTAHTLEATELGRLIQILKASGAELKK
jgi:hypothetical protein